MSSWLGRHGDTLAVLLLSLIGLYDVAIGAFMLLSDAPWVAHGPGTVWLGVEEGAGSLSLFRRMGAFSLHAGVAMLVWAWLGRREPRVLLALLLTCSITGLAFAWTDRSFFVDTPYLQVKNGLGGVFALAFLSHLGARWAGRAPD